MSTTIPDDQACIEFIIRAMVDHPDDVLITRTVDDLGVLLAIRVHPSDIGKIIGKGGQTIKSLRILLRVVGAKDNGNRVNLRLVEDITT